MLFFVGAGVFEEQDAGRKRWLISDVDGLRLPVARQRFGPLESAIELNPRGLYSLVEAMDAYTLTLTPAAGRWLSCASADVRVQCFLWGERGEIGAVGALKSCSQDGSHCGTASIHWLKN